MKFKRDDLAYIHSTADSKLDGALVRVIGVALNFNSLMGSIYIVMLPDELKVSYNGWDTLCITESCLELV